MWLSDLLLEVTASILFIVFCWLPKTKAQSTQGEGPCFHCFLGSMVRSRGARECGKTVALQPLGKCSLHPWMLLSLASVSQIVTCTQKILTPPVKPQLCKQDKYPEISLEPSDAATCILTYSWNTLCELFMRVHISYTLTAIFLSMLTASVHHSYSNEGKNQCQRS